MTNTPWLSLARITGDDRISFLQGQLTQDVNALSAATPAALSACCDPKGRVIAVLTLIYAEDAVLAALRSDIVDDWSAHILKYRMRARVDISVEKTQALVSHPSSDASPTFDLLTQQGTPQVNAWRVGENIESVMEQSAPPTIAPLSDTDWAIARLRAGIADIGPSASGKFTPHMLGLPALGGVSFSKGCYTGQEIVARTEHLGAAKRQPVCIKSTDESPVHEGAELFVGDKKVGTVATATRDHAIAVVNQPDADTFTTAEGSSLVLVSG